MNYTKEKPSGSLADTGKVERINEVASIILELIETDNVIGLPDLEGVNIWLLDNGYPDTLLLKNQSEFKAMMRVIKAL